MPVRVQRSRNKGWRNPPNTKYVGRPSKWGNIFPVDRFGAERAVELYKELISGTWNPKLLADLSDDEYRYYYRERDHFLSKFKEYHHDVGWAMRVELRGYNISCWCSEDRFCHGSLVLEIANA